MKFKVIDLGNEVYRERTLLELPQVNLFRPSGSRNRTSGTWPEPNARKQVIELRSANLSMTGSEIAKKVGISRQRVFQILQQEGLPTGHPIKKLQYQCPVCGNISPRKFCCNECKKKWHQVPIVCTRCGKLFLRKLTRVINDRGRNSHSFFVVELVRANGWEKIEY
jgi:transcriptional regulator with XRE-family HTH domain